MRLDVLLEYQLYNFVIFNQKIKHMNKSYLILLCLLVSLGSCRKDDVIDIKEPIDPTETSYVKDIYGLIEDELGQPIANVEMSIKGITATTNKFGLFTLKDVSVAELKGSFIKASHDEYFFTGTRVYAKNEDKDFIKIVLVKKELNLIFTAGESAELGFNDGTKIEFLNGRMSYNGLDYNGKVNVYAYHLDPTSQNFLQRSPGDLSAINEEGNYGLLNSFGMLAVELRGSNGEKLELGAGSTARITVPVPNDLLSSANPTIPLWHFDEDNGIWKEEGEANLINGAYVGEVQHFSWWNCDDFSDPITLCVQLVQPQRNSYFTEVKVELTSSIFGVTCDYTDEDGRVCGQVPANEILTIKIYDVCGNVIYESTIGPYISGPVEELVEPNLSSLDFFEFSGQVSECGTNNGLSNAYIIINANGHDVYTATDANGNYYVEKILCSSSVNYTMFAVHPISGNSGTGQNSGPSGAPLVLDIDLCDDTPFIIINDLNGNVLFEDSNATLKVKPNETILFGNTSGSFFGGFQDTTTGNFPINAIILGDTYREETSTITINQWGAVGTIIKGEFNLNNGNALGYFVALRTE